MGCIQIALSDTAKADRLRGLLTRTTQMQVQCVGSPSLDTACVAVVDPAHLQMLASPLAYPERVVLIAPNDSGHFKDAWEAGVNSVVSDEDPPNTIVLAILSACLRSGNAASRASLGKPA